MLNLCRALLFRSRFSVKALASCKKFSSSVVRKSNDISISDLLEDDPYKLLNKSYDQKSPFEKRIADFKESTRLSYIARKTTFEDMKLHPELCKVIKLSFLWDTPTTIQQLVIPGAMEGKNIIASSFSGTGKTSSYLLPILHQAATKGQLTDQVNRGPLVLIVVPTAELCLQVAKVTKILLSPLLGDIYGKRSVVRFDSTISLKSQVDMLMRARAGTMNWPLIAVGTPTRLVELINTSVQSSETVADTEPCSPQDKYEMLGAAYKGMLPEASKVTGSETDNPALTLDDLMLGDRTPITLQGEPLLPVDQVQYFVLDECDMLLNATNIDKTFNIWKHLPRPKDLVDPMQTFLISATLSENTHNYMLRLAPHHLLFHLNDVFHVSPMITQEAVLVPHHQKSRLLKSFLTSEESPSRKVIVFTRSAQRAQRVADYLTLNGVSGAQALHGGQSFERRKKLIQLFSKKRSAVQVIVSTDIATRGLDFEHCDVVVNYDVPEDPVVYMHRIGRSARAGRRGASLTLVNEEIELYYFRNNTVYRNESQYLEKIRQVINSGPSVSKLVVHVFNRSKFLNAFAALDAVQSLYKFSPAYPQESAELRPVANLDEVKKLGSGMLIGKLGCQNLVVKDYTVKSNDGKHSPMLAIALKKRFDTCTKSVPPIKLALEALSKRWRGPVVPASTIELILGTHGLGAQEVSLFIRQWENAERDRKVKHLLENPLAKKTHKVKRWMKRINWGPLGTTSGSERSVTSRDIQSMKKR